LIRAALLLVPLLLVAALTAVACGGRRHDDAAPLTLWAMGREGEVIEQLVPDFEARHPGLRVEVQRIPWSAAHEKLLTSFVGGAMPDVVQVGNTWVPELVVLGAPAPLDERVRGSAVGRDDWFPGVVDPNVVDGTLWAVPWYVDTRILFYRSDLVPHPPPTWDGWAAALAAARDRQGGDAYGILLQLTEWQPLVIMAMGRGSTLLRDGDCRGDFRNPAFRDALAFYVELFRRRLAPLGGAASAANVYQDFAAGDVSAVVTGPWNLGEFASRLPAGVPWATAPIPASSGPPPGPSLAGGASLVLVRTSPRQDDAWKLIEFLSEPAQQIRLHELTGDLPVHTAAWRDPRLAGDPRVAAFRTQLDALRATPKIPEWERIAGKITQFAEAAIRGTMTVDEATAALDAAADEILEKRRWLEGACG
jgi:multiple sugar transport system substrate-binding protein